MRPAIYRRGLIGAAAAAAAALAIVAVAPAASAHTGTAVITCSSVTYESYAG